MNRNSVRSRPMPTAPDWAICDSSMGSSRLACNSMIWPSSVWAGMRRRRAKRCRSRANAVTARRAEANVVGEGLITTVPAPPSTTTTSPGLMAFAMPAAPSTAGTPRARSMTAVCPSVPPSSVATPANREGSSSAASAGRNASLNKMAPSGRPAKLRNGACVRLRTKRRPISRTSSACRRRLALSSPLWPASAVATIALAMASASVATAFSADSRVSSIRRLTPRIRRDGPIMRM